MGRGEIERKILRQGTPAQMAETGEMQGHHRSTGVWFHSRPATNYTGQGRWSLFTNLAQNPSRAVPGR